MVDSINPAMSNSIQKVNIDWESMTAKEILEQETTAEDVPAAIVQWAEEISSMSKIPDSITYESVDGETDIEALNALINPGAMPEDGATDLAIDEQVAPIGEVGDVDPEAQMTTTPGAEGARPAPPPPPPGTEGVTDESDDTEVGETNEIAAADEGINADTDELIRRKERREIKQQ